MDLYSYLTFQWGMLEGDLSETILEIGESLIDAVDSDGYLRQYSDILKQYGETETEKAIELLQTLDPTGVGARTIEECLWLQLKDTTYNEPVFKELVYHYLEDLAENRMGKIQEDLKLQEDCLFRFKQFLMGLEPRPGRVFASGDRVNYVVPDCFLTWEGETPVVRISENSTPRLRISSQYRSILRDPLADEATKDYVKERLNKALLLIKNIESRRETLRKVITYMVTVQKQFFEDGTLVPLTMQEVAEGIDMHESTVSRAVRGKYLQTSGGSIALKSFFVRGIAKDQSQVSVDTVKKAIADLIKEENKEKPLSDQAITRALKDRGVSIARRTVAKYREELGFFSSSKRRVKKS
ncbi:MAG: RNA polymerase factor sigma-54 [Eubacteriaceae bacterium]|jgi:RNA polymerase sigma-54 factor|nr:RNA polymerase factor sigma-54 [Eubacteriaceae bacterium]